MNGPKSYWKRVNNIPTAQDIADYKRSENISVGKQGELVNHNTISLWTVLIGYGIWYYVYC